MFNRAFPVILLCGAVSFPVYALVPEKTPSTFNAIITAAADEPTGAHAAIVQAQEWLAEIDATLSVIQRGVDGFKGAVRQKAAGAVARLHAIRDDFSKEIDGLVAQAQAMSVEQLAAARAALTRRWTDFEHGLDTYVAEFKLDVQQKKAVILARIQAEQTYLRSLVTGLKAKAAALTAQERAAVEARLEKLQARVHEVESRFGRLKTASESAWSALKQGFVHSRQILDNAYDDPR